MCPAPTQAWAQDLSIEPVSYSVQSFWPQNDSYNWTADPSFPFTTSHASLTHEALSYHTKLEPCPSPPLFLPSPGLSSVGSIPSDDQNCKRRRIQSPGYNGIKGARLGRSLSPQSAIGKPIVPSTRRYRPILPALARKEDGHHEPPRRVVASAPPSPHRRLTSLSSVPSTTVATPFEHSPTNLPPRKYAKGQDSPFRPEKMEGTIPGSLLDTLPLLEARFDRLETAIASYAQSRAQRALRNSLIFDMEPESL